jgi:hypothetical protein
MQHSPDPWRALIEDTPTGVTVKVVDKNGGGSIPSALFLAILCRYIGAHK